MMGQGEQQQGIRDAKRVSKMVCDGHLVAEAAPWQPQSA